MAMASDLTAMTSNLIAMASNLIAMASNLTIREEGGERKVAGNQA